MAAAATASNAFMSYPFGLSEHIDISA